MRISRQHAPGWRRVMVLGAIGVAVLMGGLPARAQSDDSPAWPSKPKPAAPAKPKPKTPALAPAPADAEKPKPPETEADRIKREARELFDPGARPASGDGASESEARGWAIVLGVFRGEERDSASAVMLRRVRDEGGLPRAYALRRNDATVVAVGDFASPEDPVAIAELKRIQEIQFGGLNPYAKAFLSPPQGAPGKMPQYNLLRAKEQFGEKAIYTLQIGAYGRRDLKAPTEADLAESRRTAEQAAYRLRQEGELAFYYHASTMSMVTIGVFDLSDFDPQIPGFKSEALKAAQKRFPYNLYNGAGIKEKRKGPNGRVTEQMQASNLVALPAR